MIHSATHVLSDIKHMLSKTGHILLLNSIGDRVSPQTLRITSVALAAIATTALITTTTLVATGALPILFVAAPMGISSGLTCVTGVLYMFNRTISRNLNQSIALDTASLATQMIGIGGCVYSLSLINQTPFVASLIIGSSGLTAIVGSLFLAMKAAQSIEHYRQFKTELDAWVNDPTVTGNKQVAAEKIIAAYKNSDILLWLNNLNLSSIPDAIGKLTQLISLRIGGNQLTSLPDSIRNLTKLDSILLIGNQLTHFPEVIEHLTQLTVLDLSYNQLTSIPETIENLTQLRVLNLTSNRLTSLPIALGRLNQLEILEVNLNSDLSALPMPLAELANLTHIGIDNTRISRADRDAILASSKAKRDQNSGNELEIKLKLWKQYANKNDIDLEFILQKSDQEKAEINEWLKRLAQTYHFADHQKELAQIVCDMLSDAKDDAFYASFIAPIAGNNENCPGRAEMGFNELYLNWKLWRLEKESISFEEKLKLITSAARTTALRKALAKKLEGQDHRQSVHVYLDYEVMLQKDLELLTIIKRPHYAGMGYCRFDIDELKKTVRENYILELAETQAFKDMYTQDKELVERLQKLTDDATNEMTDLVSNNEAEYLQKVKEITLRKDRAIGQELEKWIETKVPKRKTWFPF